MDIVGVDELFMNFSDTWLTNVGNPHKEKNKDMWVLPDE